MHAPNSPIRQPPTHRGGERRAPSGGAVGFGAPHAAQGTGNSQGELVLLADHTAPSDPFADGLSVGNCELRCRQL